MLENASAAEKATAKWLLRNDNYLIDLEWRISDDEVDEVTGEVINKAIPKGGVISVELVKASTDKMCIRDRSDIIDDSYKFHPGISVGEGDHIVITPEAWKGLGKDADGNADTTDGSYVVGFTQHLLDFKENIKADRTAYMEDVYKRQPFPCGRNSSRW